jgi:hypothetical protein
MWTTRTRLALWHSGGDGSLFGCVDGEEQEMENCGVCGASAVTAHKSHIGDLFWSQQADHGTLMQRGCDL